MFSNRIVSILGGSLLLTATLLASSPTVSAESTNGPNGGALDVGVFFDSLKDDGEWFNTTDFGDVWQPYIAYKSDSWRPYTDGYWTYTDGGWMFISYENFGWAVYHYGRWTQLKDIGWAWVPGTDWSPAWVTWRESSPGGENGQPAANVAATSTDADQSTPPRAPSASDGTAPVVRENYIGWAPLPPDPEPVVYASGYAYGPSVDIDYDIDPYDYVFTDVRYFGAPWIGGVIFDRDRSYDCCERSVNVTNIYYSRQGAYQGFYSGGPRYERFNGITERPIPRYNLNRQQGRLAQDALRAGRFNQVEGNKLNVVAPRFSQANMKNGHVNFKNRGALPVTAVERDRPAAQANNEARQKARNTFRQQGETFRAQNPKSQSALRATRQAARAGDHPDNSGIATTPRAQGEGRQARGAAIQRAGDNPAAQPEAAAAAKTQTRSQRRSAERETRRQASGSEAGSAARRQSREERRTARQSSRSERQERPFVPNVGRESRHNGGGGGGMERVLRGGGGNGGGRAAGGGGGEKRGGGGGGGGGGEGKKKK